MPLDCPAPAATAAAKTPAIWRALSEPATRDELVDLAALAVPETGRALIEAGVGSILRGFLSEKLIEAA